METEKMVPFLKKNLLYFPEICFIAIIGILISSFLTGGISVNLTSLLSLFIFVTLFICLLGQFRWRNFYLSIIISGILGFGSFYMLWAVYSEYRDFAAINPKALILLIGGVIIFVFLIIMSFIMPLKYRKNNKFKI